MSDDLRDRLRKWARELNRSADTLARLGEVEASAGTREAAKTMEDALRALS